MHILPYGHLSVTRLYICQSGQYTIYKKKAAAATTAKEEEEEEQDERINFCTRAASSVLRYVLAITP